jgi:hypothetical protein
MGKLPKFLKPFFLKNFIQGNTGSIWRNDGEGWDAYAIPHQGRGY